MLETDLSDNSSRVRVLEEDLTSNAGRVSVLETDLASNAERVSVVEDDLTSNALRVGILEENLTSNAGRVRRDEPEELHRQEDKVDRRGESVGLEERREWLLQSTEHFRNYTSPVPSVAVGRSFRFGRCE